VHDGQGNFWFVHNSAGIVKFDVKNNSILSVQHKNGDATSISSDSIASLTNDVDGNTWIVHASGIVEQIVTNQSSYKVTYRTDYLKRLNQNERFDYQLYADAQGDIWLFAANGNQGVFYFNKKDKSFKHFHKDAPVLRMNTNIVRGIVQDNKGLIWIATDHGGINVIDKKGFSIQYITHHEEDVKSLAQNSINALYKDDQGIIWIGTFKKGISYYHENIIRFPLYKKYLLDPKSLPYEDVN
ncbi:MAG: two-component regulator propeller domain-containing protein, partial [Chryseolinea sp.]